MSDKIHRQTDEKLEKMERHLSAIYSRAKKEVGKSWKEYLSEVGKEIEYLQKDYDAAKKTGDRDEIKSMGKKLSKAKRERTLLDKHYRNLTKRLAEEISRVNEIALSYINGELPKIYSMNYNQLETVLKNVGGYAFELVDAATVKNLATSDKSLLPYKEIDKKKDIRWNTKKLNAEILQGILQGEPMKKIADRLENVENMNKDSAIRNARTMVTSAENKGRFDSYEKAAADGIILERTWIATKDGRTRHSHAIIDGETRPIDKHFSNGLMYPGDPNGEASQLYNCRCSMVANVKGFKKT